jgi:hypothetical protein
VPFILSCLSLRLSFITAQAVGSKQTKHEKNSPSSLLFNNIMALNSICVSFLVLSCKIGMLVAAQDQQVQYNQVINLNGDVSPSSSRLRMKQGHAAYVRLSRCNSIA